MPPTDCTLLAVYSPTEFTLLAVCSPTEFTEHTEPSCCIFSYRLHGFSQMHPLKEPICVNL